MEIDGILSNINPRREEFIRARRDRSARRIAQFMREFSRFSQSGFAGNRFSNSGPKYSSGRFAAAQNEAEDRFIGPFVEDVGTSAPSSTSDVRDGVVDDFTRLKSNERSGKYVGSFNPFGGSKKNTVPTPYKFDEF
nr:hypothetical protein [Cressdnaviricota sp.]